MLKLKNRKGVSLTTAIMATTIVLLIGVVITGILTTNAIAARRQREFTQAYYLALAGTEIGTSAVLRRSIIDNGFPVLEYFQNFTGDFSTLEFTETIRFGPSIPGLPPASAGLPDYNGSKVEIWIRPVRRDGTPITASGAQPANTVWVEILARSTFYNDGQLAVLHADPSLDGTIGTRHAIRVRYNTQEPEWSIREIVNPNF